MPSKGFAIGNLIGMILGGQMAENDKRRNQKQLSEAIQYIGDAIRGGNGQTQSEAPGTVNSLAPIPTPASTATAAASTPGNATSLADLTASQVLDNKVATLNNLANNADRYTQLYANGGGAEFNKDTLAKIAADTKTLRDNAVQSGLFTPEQMYNEYGQNATGDYVRAAAAKLQGQGIPVTPSGETAPAAIPVTAAPAPVSTATVPYTKGLANNTTLQGNFTGLVTPGNIDLTNRPIADLGDGRKGTVLSRGYKIDGKQVLLPSISPEGRVLSDDETIQLYKDTGQHLGVFDSVDASNAYAEALHNQQQGYLDSRQTPEAAPAESQAVAAAAPAADVKITPITNTVPAAPPASQTDQKTVAAATKLAVDDKAKNAVLGNKKVDLKDPVSRYIATQAALVKKGYSPEVVDAAMKFYLTADKMEKDEVKKSSMLKMADILSKDTNGDVLSTMRLAAINALISNDTEEAYKIFVAMGRVNSSPKYQNITFDGNNYKQGVAFNTQTGKYSPGPIFGVNVSPNTAAEIASREKVEGLKQVFQRSLVEFREGNTNWRAQLAADKKNSPTADKIAENFARADQYLTLGGGDYLQDEKGNPDKRFAPILTSEEWFGERGNMYKQIILSSAVEAGGSDEGKQAALDRAKRAIDALDTYWLNRRGQPADVIK